MFSIVGRHEDRHRRHRHRAFPLPPDSHRRQPGGLPRARRLQQATRTCSRSNPLLPVIEIALLLVFLIHIYKTVRMFLGNQSARPVALRAEEIRRAAEPQVVRVVDDDRLGALAAGVSRRPRQGVPLRRRAGVAGRRARSVSLRRWRAFANPLIVGFYVHQHGGGRLAPVARHLERVPVARPRHSRRGRRVHPARRQGDRGR